MRRRREMVQARRDCKPSFASTALESAAQGTELPDCKAPLEKFEAEKVSSSPPPPVVVAGPVDRYSELLRLYRIEGAEAVRAAFTVEELQKLARVHGFEIGKARTKAQIIEVLLG